MFTLGGHLEVDGSKEAPTPLMVFGLKPSEALESDGRRDVSAWFTRKGVRWHLLPILRAGGQKPLKTVYASKNPRPKLKRRLGAIHDMLCVSPGMKKTISDLTDAARE